MDVVTLSVLTEDYHLQPVLALALKFWLLRPMDEVHPWVDPLDDLDAWASRAPGAEDAQVGAHPDGFDSWQAVVEFAVATDWLPPGCLDGELLSLEVVGDREDVDQMVSVV